MVRLDGAILLKISCWNEKSVWAVLLRCPIAAVQSASQVGLAAVGWEEATSEVWREAKLDGME